jgi:hypothetical protein
MVILDPVLWHLDELDVQSSSSEMHQRLLVRLCGSRNEHLPRLGYPNNAAIHPLGSQPPLAEEIASLYHVLGWILRRCLQHASFAFADEAGFV